MNVLKLLLPIALAALAPHSALAITGDKAEFRKVADDVYAFALGYDVTEMVVAP